MSGLYTKGEIEEVPTGWNITIYDPDETPIAEIRYPMYPQQKYTQHIANQLNSEADGLLSHLNR